MVVTILEAVGHSGINIHSVLADSLRDAIAIVYAQGHLRGRDYMVFEQNEFARDVWHAAVDMGGVVHG